MFIPIWLLALIALFLICLSDEELTKKLSKLLEKLNTWLLGPVFTLVILVPLAPGVAGFMIGEKLGWDRTGWKPYGLSVILAVPYWGLLALIWNFFRN